MEIAAVIGPQLNPIGAGDVADLEVGDDAARLLSRRR